MSSQGKNPIKFATHRKTLMRTARDVVHRVLWDEGIPREYVIVGYLDRFVGVLEKPFDSFKWGDIAMASIIDLAIPEHRLMYFKYKGEFIWHKQRRLDRVFGSTPPFQRIADVMANIDEAGEARSAGFVENRRRVGERPASGDRNQVVKEEWKLLDGRPRGQGTRPNFFVCVRVASPEIRAAVKEVQEHMVNCDKRLADGCIQQKALHITLVMCRLSDESQVATAYTCLESCASKLLAQHVPTNVEVSLDGVRSFGDRVVYVRAAETGRLEELVGELKSRLSGAGIRLPGNADPYTPHMTICKLTRPMSREIGSIDRSIWAPYHGRFFGSLVIRGIHLCSMEENKALTGFYATRGTFFNTPPQAHVPALGFLFSKEARITLFPPPRAHREGKGTEWKAVVVLRGVPGSGKSWLTGQLKERATAAGFVCEVVSADHFFGKEVVKGTNLYSFSKERLSEAHSQCFRRYKANLANYEVDMIVVDNTNTQRSEFQPYLDEFALWTSGSEDRQGRLTVVEMSCGSISEALAMGSRSSHKVPSYTTKDMWSRWQVHGGSVILAGEGPPRKCDGRGHVNSIGERRVVTTDGVKRSSHASVKGHTDRQIASTTEKTTSQIEVRVILGETSRQELIRAFPPRHDRVRAHHVALEIGEDFVAEAAGVPSLPLGALVGMSVVGVAENDRTQVLYVDLDLVEGKVLARSPKTTYITVSSAHGTRPVDSLSDICAQSLSHKTIEAGEQGLLRLQGIVALVSPSRSRNRLSMFTSHVQLGDNIVPKPSCKLAESYCMRRDAGTETCMIEVILPQHARQPPGAAKRLHVFDFDATIFDTPNSAEAGVGPRVRGWFSNPESLLIPLQVGKGNCKISPGPALSDLRHFSGWEGSATVLLTGRHYEMRDAVWAVLEEYGVDKCIDAAVFKPCVDTNTAQFKVTALKELLATFSSAKEVTVWDDNQDNIMALSKLYVDGVSVGVIPVHPGFEGIASSLSSEGETAESVLSDEAGAHISTQAVQVWLARNGRHRPHRDSCKKSIDMVKRAAARAFRGLVADNSAFGHSEEGMVIPYGTYLLGRHGDIDLSLVLSNEGEVGTSFKKGYGRDRVRQTTETSGGGTPVPDNLIGQKEASQRSPDSILMDVEKELRFGNGGEEEGQGAHVVMTYVAMRTRVPRLRAVVEFEDHPPIEVDVTVRTARVLDGIKQWGRLLSRVEETKATRAAFSAALDLTVTKMSADGCGRANYLGQPRSFQVAEMMSAAIFAEPAPPGGWCAVGIVAAFCRYAEGLSFAEWRNSLDGLVKDMHIPPLRESIRGLWLGVKATLPLLVHLPSNGNTGRGRTHSCKLKGIVKALDSFMLERTTDHSLEGFTEVEIQILKDYSHHPLHDPNAASKGCHHTTTRGCVYQAACRLEGVLTGAVASLVDCGLSVRSPPRSVGCDSSGCRMTTVCSSGGCGSPSKSVPVSVTRFMIGVELRAILEIGRVEERAVREHLVKSLRLVFSCSSEKRAGLSFGNAFASPTTITATACTDMSYSSCFKRSKDPRWQGTGVSVCNRGALCSGLRIRCLAAKAGRTDRSRGKHVLYDSMHR
ncbi:unnamed protein product [Discosporangium mesarthrocarpum]